MFLWGDKAGPCAVCHSLLWMLSSAVSILVKTPPVLCSASWPSPSTTPLQFNTLWVPEQQLSSSEMSQPGPGILQIEFKSQLCFGMLSAKCFNLPVPNQEALPVLGLRGPTICKFNRAPTLTHYRFLESWSVWESAW